jgi:hypothetical protein
MQSIAPKLRIVGQDPDSLTVYSIVIALRAPLFGDHPDLCKEDEERHLSCTLHNNPFVWKATTPCPHRFLSYSLLAPLEQLEQSTINRSCHFFTSITGFCFHLSTEMGTHPL